MISRKKILFIARWYPDRHDSMLGLFVQKHGQAVQQFHDVTALYVTADATLPPGKIITDHQVFEGISEYRIYFGKYHNRLYNAFAYAKNYIEAINTIKKNSGLPDLVHVHILSRSAFPAMWLKLTRDIPYVITEHWSRYLPVNVAKGAYPGRLRKIFTKLAVAFSEGVTTVTQNLADAMVKQGLKNKYVITPNVADIHDFHPEPNPIAYEVKKLIHVSCFDEPAKNVKGIINVFSKIAAQRTNVILEVIGDGRDYHEVVEYANQTGLVGNRIFFRGLVTGPPLSEAMRTAEALVMFSNYENLPCTIVESLCCGVPVISTDVGGIREHVQPEFGTLLSAGNEEQLKRAIENSLDHPEKFNRVAMRKYAEVHFSMEALGRQFNDIYSSILIS